MGVNDESLIVPQALGTVDVKDRNHSKWRKLTLRNVNIGSEIQECGYGSLSKDVQCSKPAPRGGTMAERPARKFAGNEVET